MLFKNNNLESQTLLIFLQKDRKQCYKSSFYAQKQGHPVLIGLLTQIEMNTWWDDLVGTNEFILC